MSKLAILFLATSILCSCGVKGDLYLPNQEQQNKQTENTDK